MAEPNTEIFHRGTTSNIIKTYFMAIRPAFLTASALPVLTTFAYVWSGQGGMHPGLALVILISMVCIHAAANVLNDYFDSRNGSDAANTSRIYPFTGGSRFIQNGVLSEQQMLVFGLLLLGAGIAGGVLLLFFSGPLLIIIGLLGVMLAYFYSAPPCLACHGLGDLAIATCFGLLPVMGTVYILGGDLDVIAVWIGLVIGCFVAAILWINSVPDIRADRQAGKHTWPGRLNESLASRMHGLWFLAGFGLVLLTPLAAVGWLVFFAVIPAAAAALAAFQGRLRQAIPLTIATHAAVCLLLAVQFLLV